MVNESRISTTIVKRFIRQFEQNERYYEADKAITKLINAFPSNSDLSAVLIKVTTINKLYSTNIMAPFDVAKHIVSLNLDHKIASGQLSAVNSIRHVCISGIKKDFYSFATKYCNWHNLEAYPIYDSFVEKSLRYFKCISDDIRIYKNLKVSIDRFQSQNNITEFTYKQIDKFLWMYGKTI